MRALREFRASSAAACRHIGPPTALRKILDQRAGPVEGMSNQSRSKSIFAASAVTMIYWQLSVH
jgi:hypothetical protein